MIMTVEYKELFGGDSFISCLLYKNGKQVGIIMKRGGKNDAFMIPIQAAKELIEELQTAIKDAANGITE